MSETLIDWNDPDFCKKYQYRNGKKIVAVHSLPRPFCNLTDYCYFTTDGAARHQHLSNGRICNSYVETGPDIVPVPREPRRGEGFGFVMTACPSSIGLSSFDPNQKEKFKIRWEEVIE